MALILHKTTSCPVFNVIKSTRNRSELSHNDCQLSSSASAPNISHEDQLLDCNLLRGDDQSRYFTHQRVNPSAPLPINNGSESEDIELHQSFEEALSNNNNGSHGLFNSFDLAKAAAVSAFGSTYDEDDDVYTGFAVSDDPSVNRLIMRGAWSQKFSYSRLGIMTSTPSRVLQNELCDVSASTEINLHGPTETISAKNDTSISSDRSNNVICVTKDAVSSSLYAVGYNYNSKPADSSNVINGVSENKTDCYSTTKHVDAPRPTHNVSDRLGSNQSTTDAAQNGCSDDVIGACCDAETAANGASGYLNGACCAHETVDNLGGTDNASDNTNGVHDSTKQSPIPIDVNVIVKFESCGSDHRSGNSMKDSHGCSFYANQKDGSRSSTIHNGLNDDLKDAIGGSNDEITVGSLLNGVSNDVSCSSSPIHNGLADDLKFAIGGSSETTVQRSFPTYHNLHPKERCSFDGVKDVFRRSSVYRTDLDSKAIISTHFDRGSDGHRSSNDPNGRDASMRFSIGDSNDVFDHRSYSSTHQHRREAKFSIDGSVQNAGRSSADLTCNNSARFSIGNSGDNIGHPSFSIHKRRHDEVNISIGDYDVHIDRFSSDGRNRNNNVRFSIGDSNGDICRYFSSSNRNDRELVGFSNSDSVQNGHRSSPDRNGAVKFSIGDDSNPIGLRSSTNCNSDGVQFSIGDSNDAIGFQSFDDRNIRDSSMETSGRIHNPTSKHRNGTNSVRFSIGENDLDLCSGRDDSISNHRNGGGLRNGPISDGDDDPHKLNNSRTPRTSTELKKLLKVDYNDPDLVIDASEINFNCFGQYGNFLYDGMHSAPGYSSNYRRGYTGGNANSSCAGRYSNVGATNNTKYHAANDNNTTAGDKVAASNGDHCPPSSIHSEKDNGFCDGDDGPDYSEANRVAQRNAFFFGSRKTNADNSFVDADSSLKSYTVVQLNPNFRSSSNNEHDGASHSTTDINIADGDTESSPNGFNALFRPIFNTPNDHDYNSDSIPCNSESNRDVQRKTFFLAAGVINGDYSYGDDSSLNSMGSVGIVKPNTDFRSNKSFNHRNLHDGNSHDPVLVTDHLSSGARPKKIILNSNIASASGSLLPDPVHDDTNPELMPYRFSSDFRQNKALSAKSNIASTSGSLLPDPVHDDASPELLSDRVSSNSPPNITSTPEPLLSNHVDDASSPSPELMPENLNSNFHSNKTFSGLSRMTSTAPINNEAQLSVPDNVNDTSPSPELMPDRLSSNYLISAPLPHVPLLPDSEYEETSPSPELMPDNITSHFRSNKTFSGRTRSMISDPITHVPLLPDPEYEETSPSPELMPDRFSSNFRPNRTFSVRPVTSPQNHDPRFPDRVPCEEVVLESYTPMPFHKFFDKYKCYPRTDGKLPKLIIAADTCRCPTCTGKPRSRSSYEPFVPEVEKVSQQQLFEDAVKEGSYRRRFQSGSSASATLSTS